MGSYTNYLNLFKWDPTTDGEEEFDIDKALNQNWDKVDVKIESYINTINAIIEEFENGINTQIANFISSVSGQIEDFEEETNTNIASFEEETNTSITNFENQINTAFENFKTQINLSISTFENTITAQIEALSEQISKTQEQHRYKITLEADLADNSELTLPAYYKVGTDSLQVYFEGCLLEKDTHYTEVRRSKQHK